MGYVYKNWKITHDKKKSSLGSYQKFQFLRFESYLKIESVCWLLLKILFLQNWKQQKFSFSSFQIDKKHFLETGIFSSELFRDMQVTT